MQDQYVSLDPDYASGKTQTAHDRYSVYAHRLNEAKGGAAAIALG